LIQSLTFSSKLYCVPPALVTKFSALYTQYIYLSLGIRKRANIFFPVHKNKWFIIVTFFRKGTK